MNKVTLKACFIFLLAAAFYWYEMTLQVAPSIMSHAIMRDLHLNAASFGMLSACYFYAFALMQIPAGSLYDKYEPRLLMTLALIICVIGTLLFASSKVFIIVSCGRFMMGLGSAFSFIGVLLIIARWFPSHYFALMAGITQFISSLGAICGEFPLAKLAIALGWQQALLIVSLIGGILAILIGCFVRNSPIANTQKKASIQHLWPQLKVVLRHSQTRWVGLYALGIWAPIAIFGALWGVPFLCVKYTISTVTASTAAMMIWLGVGAGSILLGWIADRHHHHQWLLIISALTGIITASCILYYPVNWTTMYGLLFLFGFAAGGQTLSFDVIKKNHLPENMGTASGINNMAVLMGGALFQPMVGYFLVLHGENISINGTLIYSLAAYQHALLVVPLCFFISFIVSIFFIKEPE